MSQNNFQCNDCEKDFFVSRYKSGFREDGTYGLLKAHECPHCRSDNTELKPTPKRFFKLGESPAIGKFSSASDEQKKEILKKRAKDHYRTVGKEQRRENFKRVMEKSRKHG